MHNLVILKLKLFKNYLKLGCIFYDKSKQNDNLYSKTYNIDSFIEQTKIILKEYLSSSDRYGVVVYLDDFEVVCPLKEVNQIDINSFANDLLYFKNKICIEDEETNDFNLISDNFKLDYFELNSYENEVVNSGEDSSDITENEEEYCEKLNGIVKTINHSTNYIMTKGSIKSDKYIILFTNIINNISIKIEEISEILTNLNSDKRIIFLLSGQNSE